MRKLQILKTFIDVFWFASILSGIIILFLVPYLFISGEKFDIPIKIYDRSIILDNLSSKIILTINVVAFYIFAFGVFKLRKLLELFRKTIIFEEENCLLLKQIGICFLLASLTSGISGFAYNIIGHSKMELKFSTGFDSFLFTASIGLFFMVLSEVFKIAKKATQENELTI
jgi:hypothetical protein